MITPSVTAIMTTHNEGQEVLWTIENLRLNSSGLKLQIIVTDDASTDHSCDNLPPDVLVLRNETRKGVAPGRNLAAKHAIGDVLVMLDAHMRVSPDCLAYISTVAMEKGGVVLGQIKNLYGSDRVFGRQKLAIDNGERNRLVSEWEKVPVKNEYESVTGFIAPGYGIPRKVFEQLGGWPSAASGWGQTEIALSLKCAISGTPIYIVRDHIFWHMFKSSFNYSMHPRFPLSNNYIMCRMCFDESFEQFWLPLMKRHRYFNDTCAIWSDALEVEREAFQANRKISDDEFFATVLDTTIEEAVAEYLV